MKNLLFSTVIFALTFGVFSCGNRVEVSKEGVKYIMHEHDDKTRKPKDGELLGFHLTILNHTDSVLKDSQKETGAPINMLVQKGAYKGSFEDGMKLLNVGDSATFLVSVDSLYGKMPQQLPPFIKTGTDLKFRVRLVSTESQEEYKKRTDKERAVRPAAEAKEMDAYIAKKGLKNIKTLASGVRLSMTQTTTGIAPAKGDTVKVLYTGRLLNGTVFEDNFKEGISFNVGMGQMATGFDEAIGQLKLGEKATVLLPSALAYGEQGNRGIPPNSILVFDVQLADVKKKK